MVYGPLAGCTMGLGTVYVLDRKYLVHWRLFGVQQEVCGN
jgi:hypothetical protein